jgi:hypothetical protein
MCNFFLNSATEKVTVPFSSGIHRWTQTINIAISVMFHEQCQGLRGTIPFAFKIHRRTQIVGITVGVMFHEQCRGGNSLCLWNTLTDTNHRYCYWFDVSRIMLGERKTIPFAFRINRWTQIIGIAIGVMFHK